MPEQIDEQQDLSNRLRTATPAQIDSWVQTNITTPEQARALSAVERAIMETDEMITDNSDPVPIPVWGEEAARGVLEMAEKRAMYIENFGQQVVKRAEAWQKTASELARNIRNTAVNEANAIRRETARMERAGLAIEHALNDFNPKQEKSNGRDRKTREEASSDPTNPTLGESIQRAAKKEAERNAEARARGARESDVEGYVNPDSGVSVRPINRPERERRF